MLSIELFLIPSPEKEMLHNFPNIFSKFPVKFKQHCVLLLLAQSTQNPVLKWAVSVGQNRSEYKAHRFTAEAQSEMCSSSTLASGRVPKRSWQPTEFYWLWVIRSPLFTLHIYTIHVMLKGPYSPLKFIMVKCELVLWITLCKFSQLDLNIILVLSLT